MKNKLLLFLVLLACGCAEQPKIKKSPNAFTLKGTIAGKHGPVIWLRYPDSSGKITQQKAVIKNGTFVFKGSLNSPVNAEFAQQFQPGITYIRNFFTVTFISPDDMTVSVDSDGRSVSKLTGSIMQDDWDGLTQQKKHLFKLRDSLGSEISKIQRGGNTSKNHAMVNLIAHKIKNVIYREKQIDYSFIAAHPNSYLSAYVTNYYFNVRELELDSAEKFYNSFVPTVKNSTTGRSLQREIAARKISSVGSIAPLFSKPDINGNIIDLKSFRNENYVVLDFWASYSENNPDLPKLFDKYWGKGLVGISISSFDSDSEWKAAIIKYKKTKWHNILDTAGDVTTKYDIICPPSFILLIDKKGKIIGRYVQRASNEFTNGDNEGTMDDLNKKLKETFGY